MVPRMEGTSPDGPGACEVGYYGLGSETQGEDVMHQPKTQADDVVHLSLNQMY